MRTRPFHIFGTAALSLALLAAAAGCGGGGGSGDSANSGSNSGDQVNVQPSVESPPAGAAGSPAAGSGAVAAAPAPLRFKGTTLDGKSFEGTSLAGKPVVFWFWAPWCSKCAAEGPAVAKAAKKYAGKVAFVGVAGLDKNRDSMKRFVGNTGTGGITHLDDRTGSLYKHFKVTQQSSYVFMTADGKVSRDSGPFDEAGLTSRVAGLTG